MAPNVKSPQYDFNDRSNFRRGFSGSPGRPQKGAPRPAGFVEGIVRGRLISVPLGAIEWSVFQRAQRRHYLVTHPEQQNLILAWRAWCEAEGRPLVVVLWGRSPRAQILIDYTTTGKVAARDLGRVLMLLAAVGRQCGCCGSLAWARVSRKSVAPLARLLLEFPRGRARRETGPAGAV